MIAQALQVRSQPFDLGYRNAGNALDHRTEIVYSRVVRGFATRKPPSNKFTNLPLDLRLPLLSGDSGRNVLSLVGTQAGVVPGAPGASGI